MVLTDDITEIVSRTQSLISEGFYLESGVIQTPLLHSKLLSEQLGCNLYFKCENLQNTGSFKIRGATSAITRLVARDPHAEVVTASSGNHGIGTAAAAKAMGVPITIYVPDSVSEVKAEKIEARGARLIRVAGGTEVAEQTARSVSGGGSMVYISPYNDLDVISGQGTLGCEIAEQLPGVDCIYVSVGGGGLISGIAANIKHLKPEVKMTGVWAENSPVMLTCMKAGKVIEVDEQPTLSDGTAGGLDSDSITLPLCQRLIDECQTVSEIEIARAMMSVWRQHGIYVEGSAAASLAAVIKDAPKLKGKNVVVLLCGGNITDETFAAAEEVSKQ
nr:pyridoxal-phosphate dependent enzyme [Shewanella corallii]